PIRIIGLFASLAYSHHWPIRIIGSSSVCLAERLARYSQPQVVGLSKLLEHLIERLAIAQSQNCGGIRGFDRIRVSSANDHLSPNRIDAIVEQPTLVNPDWNIQPCGRIVAPGFQVHKADPVLPLFRVLIQNAMPSALEDRSSIAPTHPRSNEPGIVHLERLGQPARDVNHDGQVPSKAIIHVSDNRHTGAFGSIEQGCYLGQVKLPLFGREGISKRYNKQAVKEDYRGAVGIESPLSAPVHVVPGRFYFRRVPASMNSGLRNPGWRGGRHYFGGRKNLESDILDISALGRMRVFEPGHLNCGYRHREIFARQDLAAIYGKCSSAKQGRIRPLPGLLMVAPGGPKRNDEALGNIKLRRGQRTGRLDVGQAS